MYLIPADTLKWTILDIIAIMRERRPHLELIGRVS